MIKRLSGIQKEVLALYRSTLREAVKKDRQQQQVGRRPGPKEPFVSLLQPPQGKNHHGTSNITTSTPTTPTTTTTTTSYAKAEFRKQAQQVKRSDFRKIEYMIRKGEKQLKVLKMPGTKVVRQGGGV